MSAVVRLVHVLFPLETYVKYILSQSTKTNSNRVIDLSANSITTRPDNNILTIGKWKSVRIIQLGLAKAQE